VNAASTTATIDPLDPELVLPRLIQRRAEEDPGHVLLIDVKKGQMTASELNSSILEWAGAFRRMNVGPEDNVAVMLPAGFDAYSAWLGLSWLRAREVPINLAYRGHMLEYILSNSHARILVISEQFLDRLREVVAMLPDLAAVVIPDADTKVRDLPIAALGRDEFLRGAQPPHNLVPPAPSDIASIVYTSGTTGPSKGVLMPWGEMTTGLEVFDEMSEGDVLYAPMPPFHLLGKVTLELVAYWRGTLVFRDVFSTQSFWPDVRKYKCDHGWLVFTMVNFIAAQERRPDDADNPLKTITMGPLFADYPEFAKRFGVTIRTVFGMTEIGWPIMTGDHVADWRSCGRARPGYDLRIVDTDGAKVPVGKVGELLVRAHQAHVMNAGYFEMPDKTEEAWRDGWFHTGDAFRVDGSGNYFFVDRIKDAIRRRGENISSFEVEAAIVGHPAVFDVAALGVPSEHGEEDVRVFVVPKDGMTLTPAELIAFLTPRMPRFMIPRFVDIIEGLPRTQTGKVRKVEMRDVPIGETTWDREKQGST
jgi:crotonobetaine/carnitine-CoA ligase